MRDRSNGSPVPTEELAAPARRALADAGYTTLEDLAAETESEVAGLHGVGPSALDALREALEEHDMSFDGGA